MVKELTYDEQKYQLLWWDGKDNGGEVVDMERGPFSAVVSLQYTETGKDSAMLPI